MRTKDVYEDVEQVLIWIGEPNSLSELAFDILEQFTLDDGTPDGSTTHRILRGSMEKRVAAIDLFTQRSYFNRV